MKLQKLTAVVAMVTAGLTLSSQANAWSQPTHKKEVKDALAYMGSAHATAEQKRAYDFFVASAGSEAAAGEITGQACWDVDDFQDVHIGDAFWGFDYAPGNNSYSSVVNYTSYHHFITMTHGADDHGNPHGGYDYRRHTEHGSLGGSAPGYDIDYWASYYLWNMYLKKSDFDTTEAHYRQGSYSNFNEHYYPGFEDTPWQPSSNAASYWYDQFVAAPSLQTIGYALHFLTDAGQVHHTMSTSANNHSDWEVWVDDRYDSHNFSDLNQVAAVINNYSSADDVSTTLTKLADEAYSHPEPLYDVSDAGRQAVAEIMIPHTVAATVVVLTAAANDVLGTEPEPEPTPEPTPEPADSDNDGLTDEEETALGTDPNNADTDGDSLGDAAEVNTHGTNPLATDTDNDGLSDAQELNSTQTSPLAADSDADGLSDGAEVNTLGTNPLVADSDADGLNDGAEVNTHGTDPLQADSDTDGITDGDEIAQGTNPNDAADPAAPAGLAMTTSLSGNTLTVNWTEGEGNYYDWIGVYAQGADPEVAYNKTYEYTRTNNTDGSVNINVRRLSSGTYDIHFLVDDSYTSKGFVSFTK